MITNKPQLVPRQKKNHYDVLRRKKTNESSSTTDNGRGYVVFGKKSHQTPHVEIREEICI